MDENTFFSVNLRFNLVDLLYYKQNYYNYKTFLYSRDFHIHFFLPSRLQFTVKCIANTSAQSHKTSNPGLDSSNLVFLVVLEFIV